MSGVVNYLWTFLAVSIAALVFIAPGLILARLRRAGVSVGVLTFIVFVIVALVAWASMKSAAKIKESLTK